MDVIDICLNVDIIFVIICFAATAAMMVLALAYVFLHYSGLYGRSDEVPAEQLTVSITKATLTADSPAPPSPAEAKQTQSKERTATAAASPTHSQDVLRRINAMQQKANLEPDADTLTEEAPEPTTTITAVHGGGNQPTPPKSSMSNKNKKAAGKPLATALTSNAAPDSSGKQAPVPTVVCPNASVPPLSFNTRAKHVSFDDGWTEVKRRRKRGNAKSSQASPDQSDSEDRLPMALETSVKAAVVDDKPASTPAHSVRQYPLRRDILAEPKRIEAPVVSGPSQVPIVPPLSSTEKPKQPHAWKCIEPPPLGPLVDEESGFEIIEMPRDSLSCVSQSDCLSDPSLPPPLDDLIEYPRLEAAPAMHLQTVVSKSTGVKTRRPKPTD